jgi:hypothetical protein
MAELRRPRYPRTELRSSINTEEMGALVLSNARAGAPIGGGEDGERLRADYEHGQWWITDLETGAQWSVVDCWTDAIGDYFGFEQVTAGDDE